MPKSHAVEDTFSTAQIDSGKITQARLQSFLRRDDQLDLSEILPEGFECSDPIAPVILASPADLVAVPFHKEGESDVTGNSMLERALDLECDLGWSDLMLCYKEQEKIPRELRGKVLVFANTKSQCADDCYQYVFYLNWDGDCWYVDSGCLFVVNSWTRNYVLVRSGKPDSVLPLPRSKNDKAPLVRSGKTLKQDLRVVVDYGLSLRKMIRAGRYDETSSCITARRFKVAGKGKQEVCIELLHYDKVMITTYAVFADMHQRGYRPAKIEELLALGAQHPDEQRKYWIVELGSTCVETAYCIDHCCCCVLRLHGHERRLSRVDAGKKWDGRCRFAAVRKSDEDFDQIDNVERVKRSAEAFMAGKTLKQDLRVVVDYGLSLRKMIRAGRYDWVCQYITDWRKFKVVGKGKQEIWIELLHYGKDVSTNAVVADMYQRGYRPAKIEELLALCAQHPDEQCKYWIAGLGSAGVYWYSRYLPYLRLHGHERRLSLRCDDYGWPDHCRFAAVRKS